MAFCTLFCLQSGESIAGIQSHNIAPLSCSIGLPPGWRYRTESGQCHLYINKAASTCIHEVASSLIHYHSLTQPQYVCQGAMCAIACNSLSSPNILSMTDMWNPFLHHTLICYPSTFVIDTTIFVMNDLLWTMLIPQYFFLFLLL